MHIGIHTNAPMCERVRELSSEHENTDKLAVPVRQDAICTSFSPSNVFQLCQCMGGYGTSSALMSLACAPKWRCEVAAKATTVTIHLMLREPNKSVDAALLAVQEGRIRKQTQRINIRHQLHKKTKCKRKYRTTSSKKTTTWRREQQSQRCQHRHPVHGSQPGSQLCSLRGNVRMTE